jgi:hypothetical protein
LAPKINNSLKEIVYYARDETEKIVSDGTLSIFKSEVEGFYGTFKNEKHSSLDTLVHAVSIRVFITGDLAFYATILGKENSSSTWCWLCMATYKSWQVVDNEYDEEEDNFWTVEKIKEHAMLSDASKRKGCIEAPLFDAVK